MKRLRQKALGVVGILLLFAMPSAFASGGESESVLLVTLALHLMPQNPKACLGFETVPYLNDKIHGSQAITEAKLNWESLGKVAEQQTDYTVEVRGNDFLIRPKNAPHIHDGPIVERPVFFNSMPRGWRSIAEALRGMSFADRSKKFDPSVFVISRTYAADHAIQWDRDLSGMTEIYLAKAASANPIKLSDALFLVARMANAKTWCYQSSEGGIINGKVKTPRELTHGNVSFSGPDR